MRAGWACLQVIAGLEAPCAGSGHFMTCIPVTVTRAAQSLPMVGIKVGLQPSGSAGADHSTAFLVSAATAHELEDGEEDVDGVEVDGEREGDGGLAVAAGADAGEVAYGKDAEDDERQTGVDVRLQDVEEDVDDAGEDEHPAPGGGGILHIRQWNPSRLRVGRYVLTYWEYARQFDARLD